MSTSPVSLDARKRRLRHALRSRVASIPSEQALVAGEAIAHRLSSWSDWRDASTVALFSTLPGEVDTAPLIERARREGKRILLPRMLERTRLEFAIVDSPESLRIGRYGLLEPEPECPARSLADCAIVCLPGLAFDRRGGRLGRGAGYYDRALAELAGMQDRPRFIGLGFAVQIVESVPVGSHDVRMDAIVSEAEFSRID